MKYHSDRTDKPPPPTDLAAHNEAAELTVDLTLAMQQAQDSQDSEDHARVRELQRLVREAKKRAGTGKGGARD